MMGRMVRSIFGTLALVTLVLAGSLSVAAADGDAIVLSPDFDRNINHFASYYWDETNSIDIKDQGKLGGKWRRVESDNLAFGMPQTTVWAKFRIRNPQQVSVSVALEFDHPFLEYIYVYRADEEIPVASIGSMLENPREEMFLSVALNVPPGDSDYIVRSKARANTLSMVMRAEGVYKKKREQDLGIFFLLIGAILALVLHHLFMFFSYRSMVYLLYVCLLASVGLFTLCFTSWYHFLPLYGDIVKFSGWRC